MNKKRLTTKEINEIKEKGFVIVKNEWEEFERWEKYSAGIAIMVGNEGVHNFNHSYSRCYSAIDQSPIPHEVVESIIDLRSIKEIFLGHYIHIKGMYQKKEKPDAEEFIRKPSWI